jgi:hypothetical protein
MPGPLSGPGIGLQTPQNLYPSQLYNAPADDPSNLITLTGGDAVVLPAGNWFVEAGSIAVLQYYDPITNTWSGFESGRSPHMYVKSDGFNVRLANLTGCPVASIVVAGGSSYVQATTTVTPSSGNSTWQPIVGGMLSVVSMSANGGNYGVAPLVFIPPPPSPGVPATAIATLSSGTISGVTLTNVGAGYTSVPTPVIVPHPFDPNLNAGITQATVVMALNASTTLAGAISAVLCTNPGVPTATLPTLTIAGAGTSASVVCVTLSTVLTATVSAGAGYTNPSDLIVFGGQPAGTPAYTNPAIQMTGYRPRNASIGITAGATTTTVGAVYDSGLFAGTGNGVILGLATPTTVAGVTITQGTTTATVKIQPAP